MKKRIYVEIGKPLVFNKFEENNAPIGWKRIDLLKNKLKNDNLFRAKFTKKEINEIEKVKE